MKPDSFRNPVTDGYFADPFVMRRGDTWFAYGTGKAGDAAAADDGNRVFEVRRSTDFVEWASRGCVLEPPPLPAPVDAAENREFWAPEVAEVDGRWYLYYSTGIEDRDHRLRVAVADGPEGPFHDLGRELTPREPFAIDPHPFRDEDGAWYLYYARD